jgi:hypothetical protein
MWLITLRLPAQTTAASRHKAVKLELVVQTKSRDAADMRQLRIHLATLWPKTRRKLALTVPIKRPGRRNGSIWDREAAIRANGLAKFASLINRTSKSVPRLPAASPNPSTSTGCIPQPSTSPPRQRRTMRFSKYMESIITESNNFRIYVTTVDMLSSATIRQNWQHASDDPNCEEGRKQITRINALHGTSEQEARTPGLKAKWLLEN